MKTHNFAEQAVSSGIRILLYIYLQAISPYRNDSKTKAVSGFLGIFHVLTTREPIFKFLMFISFACCNWFLKN